MSVVSSEISQICTFPIPMPSTFLRSFISLDPKVWRNMIWQWNSLRSWGSRPIIYFVWTQLIRKLLSIDLSIVNWMWGGWRSWELIRRLWILWVGGGGNWVHIVIETEAGRWNSDRVREQNSCICRQRSHRVIPFHKSEYIVWSGLDASWMVVWRALRRSVRSLHISAGRPINDLSVKSSIKSLDITRELVSTMKVLLVNDDVPQLPFSN